MKKFSTLILAVAVSIAATVSCDKKEDTGKSEEGYIDSIYDQIFEMVVSASIDGTYTKALAEAGNNLAPAFATTEHIYVYNETTRTMLIGHLQPEADAAGATLKGKFNGTISTGNSLKLIYLKDAIDYDGQDGTLDGLASGFGYATANVSVSSVTSGKKVTTSDASFTTQQSIAKLTFPVKVKSLTISEPEGLVQSIASDGTETKGDITITLGTPSTEVYVAIRSNSDSEQTYFFDVKDKSGSTYQGYSSVKIEGAKIYDLSITNLREYVDMGFGIKWATCNLGASSPTEIGDYYAWGEMEPYYEDGYAKESPGAHWKEGKTAGYYWGSYKFNPSGDGATFTKYGAGEVLDLADDVARASWGGKWRIPDASRASSLMKGENTSKTWYEDYLGTGVKGLLITSKVSGCEGNSIFLPFTGNRWRTWWYYDRSFYWLSSTGTASKASALTFTATEALNSTEFDRFIGFPVRPVIY